MSWSPVNRVGASALLAGALLVAAHSAFGQQGQPEAPAGAPAYRAALVTYGPGPIYWQRFGHNAIWLQEPARGLDHVFNFGFFDFNQESFLLRFVQGRMLYFAAMLPAADEEAYYRRENRSIRVQTLNLDPAQYARLRDFLLFSVQPENRNYLYDYYLDNCSTRIRDALDIALDGALAEQFRPQPGLETFRDHTRRSTVAEYWYYLGLEVVLGMPVDRPIDRWEEMFMPAVLADSLNEVTQLRARGLQPLVAEDREVFVSSLPPPPAWPPELWWRYLLPSLAVLALAWLAARHGSPVLVEGFMQGWLLTGGTLGLLMVAIWVGTDHAAANPNCNLLLLNPLMVLGLVRPLRKPLALLIGLAAFTAVVVAILPDVQYTRDVAALLAPLDLACALRMWRTSAPAGGRVRTSA